MTTITERDGNGTVVRVSGDLSVHEAVACVLAEMPAIEKNGTAPGNMGGYKFRRVEDVTAALKPLFAKHGVLCLPSVMTRIESERTTAASKILYCVDLEICFRFVGPHGDEIATNVWGQGTDSGDKATQKAVTSAFKTMLSVVFCISDSEMDAEAHDVPETHRPPVEPERADPEWVARVEQAKHDVLELDLTEWVKDQGWTWPWTPEACDAIAEKVALARVRPPEAPPASGEGPRPADPPAAPQAPPDPPSEPAGEPSDEELDAQAQEARRELEERISAEVGQMTTVALTDALRAAELSVAGTPKMRRARLVEHRFGEAMTADVI